MPNRVLPFVTMPVVESVDVVRLWAEGKLLMLLWMMGEGPRRPTISAVPSLLGRVGRRVLLVAGLGSAKCANSGGAWILGFSSVVSDGRRTV